MKGVSPALCACLFGVLVLAHSAIAAAPQCGDLDESGTIAATDALLLLKRAVGQNVTLLCPVCSTTTTLPATTTTSTTSTTTMPMPACDPLLQDCPVGTDGCYVVIPSGETACATPGTKSLGQDCSYINDCIPGEGCALINDPNNPTGLVCAFFCDADGAGGPTCSDTGGPGPTFVCVRLNDFYGDVDSAPPNLGICVDPNVYTVP